MDTAVDQQSSDLLEPESLPEPAQASAAPGTPTIVLGDYELAERIGAGAMGSVYRARRVSRNHPAAVKVLRPHLAKDELSLKRFMREAELIARLRHPNVVRCFNVGRSRGYYYLAMELVEGASLADWLQRLGRLSIGDALHIALACARALQHFHQSGLIHRDVKPSNLLLTQDGRIKLVDLGLARSLLEEDVLTTQQGHGAGTPVYVAPEQARDARDADPRSDLHSLGCMLYQMLTGRMPFAGDKALDIILAKLAGTYVPASQIVPDLPEELDEILRRLLAAHPDDRHQCATDLIIDLERLHLASPALSFLGGHTEPAAPIESRTLTDNDLTPTPADESLKTEKRWYVQWSRPNGEQEYRRWSAREILEAMHDETFARSAEASLFRSGHRPLAEIVEFRDAVLAHPTSERESDEPHPPARFGLPMIGVLLACAVALGVWIGLMLAQQ